MKTYLVANHFGGISVVAVADDVNAPVVEHGIVRELSEDESFLAVRYAVVDGDIVDQHSDKTDDEVLEEIAAKHTQAAEARAAEPVPCMVSKLAFMDLFTETELEAIYEGAKQSIALEVYLDKLKVAENIDLSDPRTVAGLEKLKGAGILTAERAAAILDNIRPANVGD